MQQKQYEVTVSADPAEYENSQPLNFQENRGMKE